MSRTVLLTGASGFVGVNLLKYLSDHHIHTVQISRDRLLGRKILDGIHCDSIVHLAGKAHDIKNISDPNEYMHVNFELTKKLFDEFLKSDAKKFIFISSIKAAAESSKFPIAEEHHPTPIGLYGLSKLKAEEYIQSVELPPGKQFYIIRPCMIHGSGNKGNLNLLFGLVKRGIPYPLAAYNNNRSVLYIENLCFIIYNILINDFIPSGIYNAADDLPVSTLDIVNILARSINSPVRLLNIHPAIVRSFAKVGDVFSLPFNSSSLSKLTGDFIVSNTKIKNALGKELPVQVMEGLRRTAVSFKKNSL